MEEIKFRLLRADEIILRTGQKTKDGSKQTLLLYKDARCDMARLDEQFGPYGWQRDHKDVHGVSYCGVSLWDKTLNQWITKWDAGEKSNTSPEKGEASDAFKRACVNWGIGRELYSAPRIWVDAALDPRRLDVAAIGYDDKRHIEVLVITDEKGAVIYKQGDDLSISKAYLYGCRTKKELRAMLTKKNWTQNKTLVAYAQELATTLPEE